MQNMQNTQNMPEYAKYAEYVEYAKYAKYAKYAIYAEYGEYLPIIFSCRKTKNLISLNQNQLADLSRPFGLVEQSELLACLALGLSIFVGFVPLPHYCSFLTLVNVSC